MRILHIDTGREMRGGQWQVLLLMEALRAQEHENELFAAPGAPLEQAARQAGFVTAARLAAGPRPDVIHAHDARAHTCAALRLYSTPLVVARRVAFPVKRGWLSRWKYGRATRYIAVSHYVARELEHAGIPPERIDVVRDGVRLPDLSRAAEMRAAFRSEHGIEPGAFVAGTLTSLSEKPVEPLLAAAESKRRLQVLIASADVPPGWQRPPSAPQNVTFLRPPAELSRFLFALDAFVYLSDSEGLGSAALLAMAHQLPVIASDTGGLPEIVMPEVTGLLVENETAPVGAALERFFARRADAAGMGKRGRAWVERNATDAIMAAQTANSYAAAIRSTGRA